MLTKDEFSIISSLSKIASFYNPRDYIIYDSRVIYSLNWIFFLHNIDTKYFPQPSGRNATIIEYDQKTIFNLSRKTIEDYDYKEAYSEYCKLIKNLTEAEQNIRNFDIEIFLFSIADNIIIESIKENLCFKNIKLKELSV